ncbi:MAG: MBL fold metallo-hydrolase [Phascolarctobacterium sp.]|nr:MBL fold metallo-hydrolase [Phascolarctobacterium sp.]
MSYFKIAMLASGSKGNSALIKAGEVYFLVDMGLSCRELTKRLEKVGVSPDELKGVFITHEHIDHIKGLETFTKKFSVPLYSSENTWRVIVNRLKNIRRDNLYTISDEFSIGEVKITSFSIPHDATDPHGYYFTSPNGEKCTYLTDVGHITKTLKKVVQGTTSLILETNHDVDMLKTGSYPYELKRRILSTLGHLSNESAGNFLAELDVLPEQIILAHLSQENNRPELALETVKNILAKSGKEGNFLVASQGEIVGSILSADQLSIF